ncbi:MAG: hypothetical protein DI606_00245 [Sphingobium sp.]|uniref:lipopolysaccharide biosynthesis protein n=1 Tax=Sphingobium sp. TaxID=1912891 RepID=UPI000DB15569|nr:hypothetical protein [Sphingobium sp.]PZU15041.1 MAG: hypothetical protein DI606_00245 [Sphingobium sp.]
MARSGIFVFLSGRLLSLVLLMAFQLVVVRLLAPVEYGRFAIVFAFAVLMQTVLSFGVPRLIPKYVGQAGWTLRPATVGRLIAAILAFRLLASMLTMTAALAIGAAWGWIGPGDLGMPYVAGAMAYILVSVAQVDTDAMALALGLQQASRSALVGEALVRLALISAAAAAGWISTASTLLWIGTATALAAVCLLLLRIRGALRTMPPQPEQARPLDREEFRAIAASGYASALAWFASSPATIRLVASRTLSVAAFAGFSFIQTLAVSFQRYTPGMLVFPFVEPAVMRHFSRTGDQSRLEATLALVIKIDLIVIGAAIVGTAIAGESIVGLMTGGRYVAAAYGLPWLLAYLITTSTYRAFEIVAVALNATAVLGKTLVLSLLWIGAAILLTPRYGLIALLACPVGDSVSRLAVMHWALGRVGIRRTVDLPVTASIALLMLLLAGGGAVLIRAVGIGAPGALALGSAGGTVFLLLIALGRPLRMGEVAPMLPALPGFASRLLRLIVRD